MALRVELKPGERIIIGESLITNSDSRAAFLIDGDAPILREKDILTAETADTPVRRIYLCVQMMYLEKDIAKYQDMYFEFVKDVLAAISDLVHAESGDSIDVPYVTRMWVARLMRCLAHAASASGPSGSRVTVWPLVLTLRAFSQCRRIVVSASRA